jgi:ribosomal protein S3AE
MTKQRGENSQINKIRDEMGDITTNTNEIQASMREYIEDLY